MGECSVLFVPPPARSEGGLFSSSASAASEASDGQTIVRTQIRLQQPRPPIIPQARPPPQPSLHRSRKSSPSSPPAGQPQATAHPAPL